jgi:hypothetical protein
MVIYFVNCVNLSVVQHYKPTFRQKNGLTTQMKTITRKKLRFN